MKKNLEKYFDLETLIQYGDFYKINLDKYKNYERKGKLILVTSINPTPTGEGKSTTLIGLNDCFNYADKSSLAILRQPSIGPYFGIKGGATGSGECNILNDEIINTGFTGDFYAIETANNLIYAVIENEIYQKSELNVDPERILWDRCIDMNDRSLREVEYFITKDIKTKASFNITAASQLMACFCLAKDEQDFRNTLENTLIAYSKDDKPIYIKDLKIIDSLMLIMKNALKPNIGFSKYNYPAIIHGGPFANIAHGCNTIIATDIGLKLSDYVFTEAGFGADLGAEKFLDIKCRKGEMTPNLVVIAVTIKSLKYHAGISLKELDKQNIEAINVGFENLKKHIDSIEKFNLNYAVVINKHNIDTQEELNHLKQLCLDNNIPCEISTMWQDGPSKNQHLVAFIDDNIKDNNSLNYMYDLQDNIKQKVLKVAQNVYGANNVIFTEKANNIISQIEQLCNGYFVCIAKTFASLSDDPKKLNRPTDFNINVTDIKINHSAKFVIIITSSIFLMPGLPKVPRAKK